MTDTVFNLFADGSPPAVRARPSLAALNIVILLAISCALTNIKLGSLQLQDFLLLFLLWFSITSYAYSGFSLRVSPLVRPLLRSYGLFMLSLVMMALLAVRLTFFPFGPGLIPQAAHFVFALQGPTIRRRDLRLSVADECLCQALQFVEIGSEYLLVDGYRIVPLRYCLLRVSSTSRL